MGTDDPMISRRSELPRLSKANRAAGAFCRKQTVKERRTFQTTSLSLTFFFYILPLSPHSCTLSSLPSCVSKHSCPASVVHYVERRHLGMAPPDEADRAWGGESARQHRGARFRRARGRSL